MGVVVKWTLAPSISAAPLVAMEIMLGPSRVHGREPPTAARPGSLQNDLTVPMVTLGT